MKTIRFSLIAVALFSALIGLNACKSEKVRTIALIPKGTAHSFWKAVHAGGLKAEKELGVKIIWQGPQNENDRAQQIQLVQNFVSRKVDAIVLAPLDDTALVNPVEIAVERNIPVVIIDSGLKSEKIASFVATDNVEGGRMAARELGKAMGGINTRASPRSRPCRNPRTCSTPTAIRSRAFSARTNPPPTA
jgi:ribose transport system substrate-binding protein